VVDLSCLRISSSSHDTFDEDFIRDIQEKEAVGLNTGISKGLSLSRGSRKSIKKPSISFAVRLV
jgi:hypothetical protein